ncbi:MAG: DedA family protein [Thaumarchaeota archaeon]|nr:DedA family protein [Nitrososphaerota archaeon]
MEKRQLVPRNRYLAVAAILVLVTAVIQLTHWVTLPFAGWFCGGTSLLSSGSLADFMKSYGYLSLFLLMTAESASAPIPSELILPIAGALVYEGALSSLPLALGVSTAAALAGALIDYYLAFVLGRPFVSRVIKIFRLNPADLDRAESWFERSGQWTVFAARFVPLVRALISFPAGLFRMRLRSFVLMTLAGCAVWNGILLYAGFAAGQYLTGVCAGTGENVVVDGFSLAIAGIALGYLVYFAVGSDRILGVKEALSPKASGS